MRRHADGIASFGRLSIDKLRRANHNYKTMHILITGALGQLGQALKNALTNHALILVDLPEVDITDRETFRQVVDNSRPNLIIHCAAYTNVDGCARTRASLIESMRWERKTWPSLVRQRIFH